jgi:hypothetical protein
LQKEYLISLLGLQLIFCCFYWVVFLHTFWILNYFQIHHLQVFSHNLGCHFTLLFVSFTMLKFYSLM